MDKNLQRLLGKLEKKENGCLEFTGYLHKSGYGRFRLYGKIDGAHRASYILNIGPIPEGLLVCHKCDNPPCVNPSHLFLGTLSDNMIDMVNKGRGKSPNARMSSCKRGHPFNEENTHLIKDGRKFCRKCQNLRYQANKEKIRERARKRYHSKKIKDGSL